MAFHLHTLVGSSMCCHINLLRILLSLLFMLALLHAASASSSPNKTNSLEAYKKFIKNECNSTTYPSVCNKSLSPYASKIKTNHLTLAKVSIYLALKSARSASKTLTKLSGSKNLTHAETLVIADCKENVGDTLDLLKQSADGLARLKGTTTSDEKFQWDTIKTWMSAAITDASTCTDEFDEMKVRNSLQKNIKTSVGNLSWMNSNALAFVNRLTY